jgi:triosephosphate isomerase
MRETVIAGNWKMYKTIPESAELLRGILAGIGADVPGRTVVVCPPFTSLATAGEIAKGSQLRLGAQDMSEHDEGAFTGEISAAMLRSAGCAFVILGHSERRQYHAESDERVNRKATKALAAGLRPIVCVGERLEERERGVTTAVVRSQIRGTLAGFTQEEMARVVIAYEPVWAIGTGKTATPDQAQEVHAHIRDLLRQILDEGTAEKTPILYGGSVKPDNAADLLRQPDIDGALVGGACLKAESFLAIVSAAKSMR